MDGPPVFTNAPRDWPAVAAGTLTEFDPENPQRLQSILKAGLDCEVERERMVLFGGFVFIIPLVVRFQSGQEVPVFLYDNYTSDGASWKFAQDREVSRRLGFRDAVFYALCEVPELSATSEEPLRISLYSSMLFRLDTGDPSGRDYALWWPDASGLRFPESPGFGFQDTLVTALDGFVTYYWTHILRWMRVVPEFQPRIAFGDGTYGVRVRGPNGAFFAVTAAKATGLLLHFDRETTTEPVRTEILRQLSLTVPFMCKEIASSFTRRRFKMDEADYRDGLGWWRKLAESLRAAEAPPAVVRAVDFERVEFMEPG